MTLFDNVPSLQSLVRAASGPASALTAAAASHAHITVAVTAAVVLVLAYKLTQVDLIPGKPHAILFLFSDSTYPEPRASIAWPLSRIRARWQWWQHARRRGLSSRALADTIKFDYSLDWAGGERPKRGDLLYAWDRVFEWNDDCIDMAALEGMRNLGDPGSEAVLEYLAQENQSNEAASAQPSVKHDSMENVAEHVLQHGDTDTALTQFWSAIDRRPPPGCGAVSLSWLQENGMLTADEVQAYGYCKADSNLINEPNWTPATERTFEARLTPEQSQRLAEEEARVLQRGRQAFHKYGPNMHLGLLLVGLAGGFASPRITDVLKSTGYLVQPRSKKRANISEEEDALLQRLHEYVEKGRHDTKDRIAATRTSDSPPRTVAPSSGMLDVPSPATNDRTFKRLLETLTFTLDLMESEDSLTPPSAATKNASDPATSAAQLLERGGKGWLACSRVRFLHTAVRRRLHGANYKGDYSAAKSGLAINQEDLLATLCAFSIAPLWALQRIGLPPTQQERQDLVAFWRHVGFYMGVEPRLLRRHFRDVAAAERTFCCISSHHFLPFAGLMDCHSTPPPSIPSTFGPRVTTAMQKNDGQTTVDAGTARLLTQLAARFDFTQGPALPLLWAVADRPPGHMSFATLCALGRFILGPGLANATSLPETTTWQYLTMRFRLFVLSYPVQFGTYFPRAAWAHELQTTWLQLIRRIVVWCSQGRRTTFATSRDGSHDDNYSPYALDPQQGKRIMRQYRFLLTEMVFVSMVAALVALGALAWTWMSCAYVIRRHSAPFLSALASTALSYASVTLSHS